MNVSYYFKKLVFYFSFVLVCVSIIIGYFHIQNTKNYFDEYKEFEKNKYVDSQKELLVHNVKVVNNIIDYNTQIVQKTLEERLITRVDFAHKIATTIYETNKGTLSDEHIKKIIIETLRNIKFANQYSGYTTDVYYFVQEVHTPEKVIARLLPATPNREGTNRANITDVNGKEYVKEFYNIAKTSKEGFVQYLWYKLNHGVKQQYPKTSYVKLF